MCQQLWACESFVSVLEYLLAVGNYLNQNAGKDRAKGFRLSSLTKVGPASPANDIWGMARNLIGIQVLFLFLFLQDFISPPVV